MEVKYKAITAASLFALAVTAWAGWELETVASEGDVGDGCCLAVDRWGRPHISYVDKTGGNVMYARYTGSYWEFEAVASDVNVTGNTGIALDAFDKPYVIFQDNEKNELTYGYRSGTTWVTEKVEAGSGYGAYLSISAWPAGSHVTYTRPAGTNIGLKYAYRDGGGWHTETVISSGGGMFNTLFIDNNNNPNVVYWNNGSMSVRHAVRKGGEWSIDDIAEGIDCDAYVGPNNKVHVSLPKPNNDGLNYAVSTSGSWKIENVNAYKGAPAFSQICVNAAGNVFISYFNFDNHDLRVVIKKGGTWTHEVVANSAYVGLPHSSGVSGSRPVIAYYHGDKQDLMLARYDPNLGIEPPIPADRHPREAKPGTFALFQNVPNPATGATTFSFELAEGSDVKLAIYDAAGRKVAAVAEGYFAQGQHDVPFTRELAPGVYVYRLDAGSRTAARKMVVIK
jgi:hypothetical protein